MPNIIIYNTSYKQNIMTDKLEIKEVADIVVRFSGDSGDGMQLAGNIFSTVSATVGNGISTFPDYPADIRAPQGSLTGVSVSKCISVRERFTHRATFATYSWQ